MNTIGPIRLRRRPEEEEEAPSRRGRRWMWRTPDFRADGPRHHRPVVVLSDHRQLDPVVRLPARKTTNQRRRPNRPRCLRRLLGFLHRRPWSSSTNLRHRCRRPLAGTKRVRWTFLPGDTVWTWPSCAIDERNRTTLGVRRPPGPWTSSAINRTLRCRPSVRVTTSKVANYNCRQSFLRLVSRWPRLLQPRQQHNGLWRLP